MITEDFSLIMNQDSFFFRKQIEMEKNLSERAIYNLTVASFTCVPHVCLIVQWCSEIVPLEKGVGPTYTLREMSKF